MPNEGCLRVLPHCENCIYGVAARYAHVVDDFWELGFVFLICVHLPGVNAIQQIRDWDIAKAQAVHLSHPIWRLQNLYGRIIRSIGKSSLQALPRRFAQSF